jgi:hypothetical protein
MKQILITVAVAVVVFTGCSTGDGESSSGANAKMIKIKDLFPEAAKDVLLKTITARESDGSFAESEIFYDDQNMAIRRTYSVNGSLLTEFTSEIIGDELLTTIHNINPEYENTTVHINKFKNKLLDTIISTVKDQPYIDDREARTKYLKEKVRS